MGNLSGGHTSRYVDLNGERFVKYNNSKLSIMKDIICHRLDGWVPMDHTERYNILEWHLIKDGKEGIDVLVYN
jgi:hypothetical protein